MLRADNLAFRYGARLPWVVQQFSLELAPGERVGLSGASGRGKTTLGKLLAGYLEPQQGRVLLDGLPLPCRGHCPVQLVLQHPELAINPRWRIGRVLHEAGPPAPDLLDALGIDQGWLTRWPHELSGGELQRVAVARALAAQPRYLVADEMTAMLDAATQAQLWHAVLERAQAQQIGLLVISHDDALLQRFCQHRMGLL
jgi:peptide/nickel transport system ATP-binding protein/Fe3+-transporting ATPase